MAIAWFALGLLLPSLVSAATLHHQRSEPALMRKDKTMQLRSGGETAHSRRSKLGDLCNDNFKAGKSNKNECDDPDKEKVIDDQGICDAAARQDCPVPAGSPAGTNETCVGAPFVVNDAHFNKHPAGCFKLDTGTWFYNPTPYTPTGEAGDNVLVGTPQCLQVEFINGTDDSNDCGNDKYENILTEKDCRALATCLAICTHGEFRTLGSSENGYPAGCHLNPDDGCILFNNNTALTGANAPSAPKGKPQCMVKKASTTAAPTSR